MRIYFFMIVSSMGLALFCSSDEQIVVPSGMQMVKYFEHHWKTDAIPTELSVYQELEKNPLNANVICVAIPWAVVINFNLYSSLPACKFEGEVFTVCQHDHVRKIIPYVKQLGIKVIFTPNTAHNETFDGVTLVPMLQHPTNGVDAAMHKDIFYSFIGTVWTFPIRQEIMSLPRYPDTYLKARDQWHYYLNDPIRKEAEMQEYKYVLGRSVFALCPRGVGLSSIRFSEALQAGAIPVLFDPTWKLPNNFDWENTVVWVDRKDLPNLYNILKDIPEEKVALMRANCLKAYNQFCNGTLSNPIRFYYGE